MKYKLEQLNQMEYKLEQLRMRQKDLYLSLSLSLTIYNWINELNSPTKTH